MDYAVVIPAYNEESYLPATLASLRRAMAAVEPDGELIVVDNNSSDRTAAVAREQGARVVFEPVNQISRARNAGARAAVGRWLVFVDADTLVSPGIFAEALRNLASGNCGGGGAIVALDRYPWKGLHRVIAWWNSYSVRWGMAAGSFVYCLREGFEAVGGFSTKVYASEELWFSRALRRWGKKRGLEFRIITSEAVVTSSRKANWYSRWRLLSSSLLFFLFPFALFSKRMCRLWYERPGEEER